MGLCISLGADNVELARLLVLLMKDGVPHPRHHPRKASHAT